MPFGKFQDNYLFKSQTRRSVMSHLKDLRFKESNLTNLIFKHLDVNTARISTVIIFQFCNRPCYIIKNSQLYAMTELDLLE